MKVSDVMDVGVQAVAPDDKVDEIVHIMRRHNIGAVPVVENEQPIGMVTDRDIAIRAMMIGHHPRALVARDVMTPGVVSCLASSTIEEALGLMELHRVTRLLVVDEAQHPVGMFSVAKLDGHRTMMSQVARVMAARLGLSDSTSHGGPKERYN